MSVWFLMHINQRSSNNALSTILGRWMLGLKPKRLIVVIMYYQTSSYMQVTELIVLFSLYPCIEHTIMAGHRKIKHRNITYLFTRIFVHYPLKHGFKRVKIEGPSEIQSKLTTTTKKWSFFFNFQSTVKTRIVFDKMNSPFTYFEKN